MVGGGGGDPADGGVGCDDAIVAFFFFFKDGRCKAQGYADGFVDNPHFVVL